MNFRIENLGNNYICKSKGEYSAIYLLRVENNKFYECSSIFEGIINSPTSLSEKLLKFSKIKTKDLRDFTNDVNNKQLVWVSEYWEFLKYVKRDIRKKKLEKLLS